MDPIQFIPVTAEPSISIVASLARKIWPEHYEPIIGKTQVDYMLEKFQAPQVISTQLAKGYFYYLIHSPSREPVGYFSVLPQESDLFLSKFYIASSHRGKGYGRQTLDFVQALAQKRGFARITLTVHKRNPSVAVYQKMGFSILHPIVTDIGGGFLMDDFRMAKNL
jgi:GNAT superfamily N-acetyltransferase